MWRTYNHVETKTQCAIRAREQVQLQKRSDPQQ
jgi:hypothetical protein